MTQQAHTPGPFNGDAYITYLWQGMPTVASYDDVERAIHSHNNHAPSSPYWDTDEGQDDLKIFRAFLKTDYPRASHTAIAKAEGK